MIRSYLRLFIQRYTLLPLLSLVAVYSYLIYLYWHLNTLGTFDAPGHVAAITYASSFWPAWHHWQPAEMLGWPQDLYYPPAVHWLSAGVHVLIGISVANTLKLLVSVSLVVLPISIWLYARSLKVPFSWRLPLVAVITSCLLTLPNYLGSDITGLFQIGLIPNFVSLPLVFLFWAMVEHIGLRPTWKRASMSGLLLALIIWTHLVASIIALTYLIVAIFAAVINKNRKASLSLGVSFFIGILLSSPFWIGMLQLSSITIGKASVIPSFLGLNAFILLVLLVGLELLRRKHVSLIPTVTGGGLAILGLVDSLLARHNPQASILLRLNAYRWQTFSVVFLVIVIVQLLTHIRSLRSQNIAHFFVSAGSVVLLIGVIAIKNPALFSYGHVSMNEAAPIHGRLISTMRLAQVYPSPYTAQFQILAQDKTASWANGVFVESGPNSGFIKSLERSLRPEAYINDPTLFEPESVTVDAPRVQTLLDLFAVQAVLSVDNSQTGAVGTLSRAMSTTYYHLDRRAPVALAGVPSLQLRPVTHNWDSTVLNWWREQGPVTYLPYNAEKGIIPSTSAMGVDVAFSQPNAEQIVLRINSPDNVPVLIKETYAAGWKATADNGDPVLIYQAAPSLMLISAHGTVHLTYH